jgi:hypothetical protein
LPQPDFPKVLCDGPYNDDFVMRGKCSIKEQNPLKPKVYRFKKMAFRYAHLLLESFKRINCHSFAQDVRHRLFISANTDIQAPLDMRRKKGLTVFSQKRCIYGCTTI